MLQGFLPLTSALAADNAKLAYASGNPALGQILMKADPTVALQTEKPMTDEEFEVAQKKLLAEKRLAAKTEADKAAAIKTFAVTISRLPVIATATVGVALNKTASIVDGLDAIGSLDSAEANATSLGQAKFVESAKKPVLQIISESASPTNERLEFVDPNDHSSDRLIGQAISNGDTTDQLTNKTIQKLCELERLNTYFRIETTRQSKWRKWRNFIGNEQLDIGVAAFTSLYIINTLRALQRGTVYNTTIHVSSVKLPVFGHVKNFYTHGNFFKLGANTAYEWSFLGTIPFLGIGLAQQSYEIFQNFYLDWQTRKRGFDPETTKAKAVALRDEIDGLISQREHVVQSRGGSPQETEILVAEGKILHDLRDLELDEYGRYYSAARRARPVQNAFYIPEALRRGDAIGGAIVGAVAQQRQELTIFGAFGIIETTLGILSIAAPISAVITNKIQKARAEKALIPVLTGQQIHTVEALDSDRKHFDDLALSATGSPQFNARSSVYKMASDNAAASIALTHREEVAVRQLFKTAFYLKTVAFGLLTSYGTIAMMGFGHFTNLRHVAQLGLATALQLEILSIYAAADMAVRFPLSERKIARERAQGLLPGQVLTNRIENLDRMETAVSGKVLKPSSVQ
jgi:regulator of extracellular matrix RemA (YlzA/DUF370 family)